MDNEIVIGKLDSYNALKWADRSAHRRRIVRARCDFLSDGDLAVIGTYGADIVFGTKSLTNVGGNDGFLVRINPGTGTPTYVARIAGSWTIGQQRLPPAERP